MAALSEPSPESELLVTVKVSARAMFAWISVKSSTSIKTIPTLIRRCPFASASSALSLIMNPSSLQGYPLRENRPHDTDQARTPR
jgi:hypothetical protein